MRTSDRRQPPCENPVRNSVVANVVANFLGRSWTALLGVVFVPVYAHLIGMESQGVIGLFASLQVALSVLDMGLSATLNRELAKTSHLAQDWTGARDLVRTLEIIYWGIAGLIALSLAVLAPLFAHHWLQAEQLSPHTIAIAGVLLALQLAAQFPQSLYNGGLMGLEKQVLLNGISSIVNLVRYIGVFLPLYFIRSDLITFVSWQAGVMLVATLVIRFYLWRALPAPGHHPRFCAALLRRVGKFTLGVSATALVSLPLTVVDKFLLSHFLPLESYGYYMMAFQGAGAIGIIVGPFFGAYLPRFSHLVAHPGHDGELGRIYDAGGQWLATLLVPAALTAVIFADPLIRLWLHQHAGGAIILVVPLFALMIAGNYFNGLMNLPYALTLAKGWTRFGFIQNSIASAIYLPMLYYLMRAYGAQGAAAAWVLLNLGYVFLSAPLLHRRMLPGHYANWIKFAVFLPVLVAGTVLGFSRWLIPASLGPLAQLPWIVTAAAVAVSSLVFVLPELSPLRRRLRGIFGPRAA